MLHYGASARAQANPNLCNMLLQKWKAQRQSARYLGGLKDQGLMSGQKGLPIGRAKSCGMAHQASEEAVDATPGSKAL